MFSYLIIFDVMQCNGRFAPARVYVSRPFTHTGAGSPVFFFFKCKMPRSSINKINEVYSVFFVCLITEAVILYTYIEFVKSAPNPLQQHLVDLWIVVVNGPIYIQIMEQKETAVVFDKFFANGIRALFSDGTQLYYPSLSTGTRILSVQS